MLLRASGDKDGRDYDIDAVTDPLLDSGVPSGEWLRSLTEAAVAGDGDALRGLRPAAAAEMGDQQMTDALVVAAAFNGITRVADATGIPLDDATENSTVDLRVATGIDAFAYASKSERYD